MCGLVRYCQSTQCYTCNATIRCFECLGNLSCVPWSPSAPMIELVTPANFKKRTTRAINQASDISRSMACIHSLSSAPSHSPPLTHTCGRGPPVERLNTVPLACDATLFSPLAAASFRRPLVAEWLLALRGARLWGPEAALALRHHRASAEGGPCVTRGGQTHRPDRPEALLPAQHTACRTR